MTVPQELASAAAQYQKTLGHAVPHEVLQMFAMRPGPLIMEIRQAIALHQPVAAWLSHSRKGFNTTVAASETRAPLPPARATVSRTVGDDASIAPSANELNPTSRW